VHEEFEAYLKCGRLEEGFLRVRCEQCHAEKLVAFLGLDVRVKQSGRWQGRCKLTKKGDGEVRRLLYNAAMQGRRSSQWAPYYLRLRERGMSSTAALVALRRKLARFSFALLRTDALFVPAAPEIACVWT
jgi:transposase